MPKSKRPTIALIYDFDGTLTPGNMQEYGFIQEATKLSKEAFWTENTENAKKYHASEILCYMKLMLDEAIHEKVSLNREQFRHWGSGTELFIGVKEWFDIINTYGHDKGVDIKHYINSSGLAEMIEGTPIANEFEHIYASTYMYDADGKAVWPAVAVDFTEKTQFLFMINKGVKNIDDNKEINKLTPEEDRPVPFRHMIYFGDGDTDIPCMTLVKRSGGHSIAVYKPRDSKKKKTAQKLINEQRVDFVCSADYSMGKEIYKIVTAIIDKICADNVLQRKTKVHKLLAKRE